MDGIPGRDTGHGADSHLRCDDAHTTYNPPGNVVRRWSASGTTGRGRWVTRKEIIVSLDRAKPIHTTASTAWAPAGIMSGTATP